MSRLTNAIGVFWFLVTAVLVLSAALLLIGAGRIVPVEGARLVLVALLALFAVHTVLQARHRHEPITDKRLQHDKERRGF